MSKQDDAANAKWFDVNGLPALAFDHKEVVRTAFKKLLARQEVSDDGEGVAVAEALRLH